MQQAKNLYSPTPQSGGQPDIHDYQNQKHVSRDSTPDPIRKTQKEKEDKIKESFQEALKIVKFMDENKLKSFEKIESKPMDLTGAFKDEKTFGEGHYGEVIKIFTKDGETLAAKVLKPKDGADITNDFITEMEMLCQVHKGSRHKKLDYSEYNDFILQIKGIYIPSEKNYDYRLPNIMLIMPYHKHGSLNDFLKNRNPEHYLKEKGSGYQDLDSNAKANKWREDHDSTIKKKFEDLKKERKFKGTGITYKDGLKFCLQASKAVKFLKIRGIVHRDIAARNFLVVGTSDDASELDIQLADFGLACKVGKGTRQNSN